MRIDLDGEPIHTRSLSVTVGLRPDGLLEALGVLLDVRTRGFLPVGGSMQGMGIIHHMELGWTIEAAGRVVRQWHPAQPTVAFEATPETGHESCRDPMDRVTSVPVMASTRSAYGEADSFIIHHLYSMFKSHICHED